MAATIEISPPSLQHIPVDGPPNVMSMEMSHQLLEFSKNALEKSQSALSPSIGSNFQIEGGGKPRLSKTSAFAIDNLTQTSKVASSRSGMLPSGILRTGKGTRWKFDTQCVRQRGFADAIRNVKHLERLIGEVAFQLDRRILSYVFDNGKPDNEKRRFYGYTITNVGSKLKKEAIDPVTGQLDTARYGTLHMRHEYLMTSLEALGYEIDHHSQVTSDFVNHYGLMPMPAQRADVEHFRPHNRDLLEAVLSSVVPDSEKKDVAVIVRCLAWLANADGRPMICW